MMNNFARRYRRPMALIIAAIAAFSATLTISADGFWAERSDVFFIVGVCAGVVLLIPVMLVKRMGLGPVWILFSAAFFSIMMAYGAPVATGPPKFLGFAAAFLGVVMAMEAFVTKIDMRQTRSVSRL